MYDQSEVMCVKEMSRRSVFLKERSHFLNARYILHLGKKNKF
jgi:hypothetical protein